MSTSEAFDVALLAGDALQAAHALLGSRVVHGEVMVRIVEVEAYRYPHDTACHAHRGQTPRNAPMFGPPGHAYVYLCYGIHHLLNVTTGPSGHGAAVLLRGGEVVAGHDLVRARRGGREGPDALAGPGKLAAGLGVDTSLSGCALTGPTGLRLLAPDRPHEVLAGPRIGIDYATPADRSAPWRLAIAGSRGVSHRRALRPLRDARPLSQDTHTSPG